MNVNSHMKTEVEISKRISRTDRLTTHHLMGWSGPARHLSALGYYQPSISRDDTGQPATFKLYLTSLDGFVRSPLQPTIWRDGGLTCHLGGSWNRQSNQSIWQSGQYDGSGLFLHLYTKVNTRLINNIAKLYIYIYQLFVYQGLIKKKV